MASRTKTFKRLQAPVDEAVPVKKAAKKSLTTSARSSSLASAGEQEVDSEVNKVIDGSLAAAVDNFLGRHRENRKASSEVFPAGEEASRSHTKEERIQRALLHVRDLSLEQCLTEVEGNRLFHVVREALPAVQAALGKVATTTAQMHTLQSKGKPGGASYLEFASSGLQLIRAHCTLACIFGVPPTLVAEEVSIEMVRCLKQCAKEVITPALSQPEQKDKAKVRGADADAKEAAPWSEEQAKKFSRDVAETLQGVHEFLCRQGLADELLHQLVHLCVGFFFVHEPHFPLCAAAEEVLVTLFSRHESFRSSVLQDFLVNLPKLPSGKRARRFRLPVADDSNDYGLSTWTHLLLRLVQSSCLPLHESLGKQVDFEVVCKARATAQAYVSQWASGLLQRLLITRGRDEELRSILDDIVDELLQVAFKPAWPAALALARTLAQQLLGLTQAEKRRESVEASVREAALKVVSKLSAFLYYHHVDASKKPVRLPSWSEPPDKVDRRGRLLQHIALRSSLEDPCEMPWTKAARAVHAWDADLHLSATEEQNSGLRSLSDKIVFQLLILAYIEDERVGHARFPPGTSGMASLSSAVFPAGHSIHAWTFLVGEWADEISRRRRAPRSNKASGAEATELAQAGGDAEEEVEVQVDDEEEEAPDEHVSAKHSKESVARHFLSAAWTSQAPLRCEGTSWRIGAGRRVMQASMVYALYRQVRSAELEGLRKATLDCFVVQANSAQASLRKTAMRSLSDIVDCDASILKAQAVEETIDMRLRDESSWVRQVSLDLLGRVLEESLTGEPRESGGAEGAPPNASESAKAVLLRYYQTLRGRINDTSVLVRRQASKILSAFVLAHPAHPDVVPVCLDLLKRSTDSEILRNLVIGTFELLWFIDEQPTQVAVQQLSQVVAASRTMGLGPSDVLGELLERFRKNLSARKRSKGFEYSVARWTSLLLHELVKVNSSCSSCSAEDELAELQAHRRAVLTAMEAFAVCRPREMLSHLRPLSQYLFLEETATSDDQAVAAKVCQIISAVLPSGADRKGLMDHRQVQQDLQALIKSQASAGVREAMRCLCNMVLFVTGDLGQLAVHLNTYFPTVTKLCEKAEASGPTVLEDKTAMMFISRALWTLASLLESINIDLYISHAEDAGASGKHRTLPRSALEFHMPKDSVAETMADLLPRFYKLSNTKLQGVLVTCLGFFLRGHRRYIKEPRISNMIKDALHSRDATLPLKALETLSSLLMHFGKAADTESGKSSTQFTDSRDDAVAANGDSRARTVDQDEVEKAASKVASAIESSQPLAAYTEAVLDHVGIGATSGLQGDAAAADGDKKCAEALVVLRCLHQQGLVNPMDLLPKVFSRCFARTTALSVPAGALLKEMLEFKPGLLLNRLDEAFREAFLAVWQGSEQVENTLVLSDLQFASLGEVYAERFRKQKTSREAFLKKALREIFRLDAARFQERFKSCVEAEEARGVQSGLPAVNRARLLYVHLIACLVSSLPFTHESEPLLIIFECNRHLSLHAGALVNLADPMDREPVSDVAQGEEAVSDLFGEALAILASHLLKNTMRIEYSLTAEQCAQFNPKDLKQDRLKFNVTSAKSGNTEGEELTMCAKMRFPVEDWKRLLVPFLEIWDRPAEVTKYVKRVAEGEPWDSSHSRHAEALDRLEGRTSKRGKPPAAAGGAATPAAKRPRAKSKSTAKSKGKAAAKPKPKAKARVRRTAVDVKSDDEDEDPDYDENDID